MEKEINNVEVIEKDSEAGATMIEYALLVALIAVALIAIIGILSGAVSTTFSGSASAMTN